MIWTYFCFESIAFNYFVVLPERDGTFQLYLQKKAIISFANIPDVALDFNKVERFLYEMVLKEGYRVEKVNVNFLDREELYQMNVKFLDHCTDTDIITFDYSSGEWIVAEIFISTWAVARSAETYSESAVNEMIRVLVHGFLHCLGYNDETEDEKLVMRQKENEYIKLFHVKHS